jgi:CRISPR-associated protein Csx17
MSKILDVLPFYGIRPDCLGNYLAGLGLIAAVSQKWPAIRGCWRNGNFVLIHESMERTNVENFLLNDWRPSPYERWWEKAYDEDKKSSKSKNHVEAISSLRAHREITNLRSLDATVITTNRPIINPIFGNLAGKLGAKRDFSKVQVACLQFLNIVRGKELLLVGIAKDLASTLKEINKDTNKLSLIRGWLGFTLYAEGCYCIPPIGSAGTWFVQANKTFNSGQDWYREGEISPWSFVLALEGAMLLAGSTSRRLSAKARPYAVFPFITEAPAPASEGEIGLTKAEFWAPLWEQPATLAEVRALLERGLARIGQRAAKSPHEFALAAMAAGVDAGVSTFVRFSLRQTTSSQVYEAIPREKVNVSKVESQESKLIEPLLSWIDRLPFEPSDSKQRGKFKGLRGPVEQALIKVAAHPDDPEQWRKFLICLADTQKRIDSNKNLRDRCRSLPFLSQAWFKKCWPAPQAEIFLARAIASIGAGTDTPIIVNIHGIELDKQGKPSFSGEQKPHRTVWHNGHLLHVLADVIERRLVDTDAMSPLPLNATHVCSTEILTAFLSRSLDIDLIQRWIPALSLIKWEQEKISGQSDEDQKMRRALDGTYLLHSLFRPIFHPYPLRVDKEILFPDNLMPRAMLARRLLGLIRQGSLDEAIQLVRSRYLTAGRDIVIPPPGLFFDGELMAATFLIPLASVDITASLRRWIKPKRNP